MAELLIGGLQKMLKNTSLGVPNSGKVLDELKDLYGNKGLEIYTHSRGNISLGNRTHAWAESGEWGTVSKIIIHGFGSPIGMGDIKSDMAGMGNNNADSVTFENNKGDFIGKLGWNPVTSGPKNKAGNWLTEGVRVFTDKEVNAHGCYGRGASEACKERYDPQPWKVKMR